MNATIVNNEQEVRFEMITVIMTSTLNLLLSLYQIYSQKRRDRHFKFICPSCFEFSYSQSESEAD